MTKVFCSVSYEMLSVLLVGQLVTRHLWNSIAGVCCKLLSCVLSAPSYNHFLLIKET